MIYVKLIRCVLIFLGIVRGNSEVEIKVTFAPMDFSTAHMKLQVRLLNG